MLKINKVIEQICKAIEQIENIWKENPPLSLLSLVAIILCVFIWLFTETKAAAIELIVPIGSGVLITWGIWVANRRAKAMEGNAQAVAKNVRQTEVGHRQERFRDAVTHLGHEKGSVSLGGAYALFHLACEDEARRPGIAEILCAHILDTTQTDEYQTQYPEQPSVEIQSLLTLLFCREPEEVKKLFQDIEINLHGAWLRGALLEKAQLQGANLQETQLQQADLYEAQLQKANLEGIYLQEADLREAQLQAANMQTAQLQGANLTNAWFQGAILWNAQLQGTDMTGAQFQEAHLQSSQLQGACLSETWFQGARLSSAQLQGVESTFLTLKRTKGRFPSLIKSCIGQDSDLAGGVFSGGLTREQMDSMVSKMKKEYVPEQVIENFKNLMQAHIGKPAYHKPPENSYYATGKYTKEEANQWIAEYEKAMKNHPL